MTDARRHTMSERRTPVDVTVFCSCGWYATQTRHQNAMARATKLRAAYAKHYIATLQRPPAPPDGQSTQTPV